MSFLEKIKLIKMEKPPKEERSKKSSLSDSYPTPIPATLDQRKFVIALYDYLARGKKDVNFQRGDRLEIVNDTDSSWWFVIHTVSREQGWIPSNHVVIERSASTQSWFFKCTTRGDAERLLLAEDNPRGTFLIRPAESRIDQFSLSVKEWIPDAGFQVRHYKINVAKDGYFIRKDHVFPTLNALVQAHRRISPRLLPVLSKPCPKVQPSAPPALPAQQPAPLGFNYQIMFFVIIIYFFLFSLSQKFQGN